MDDKELKEMHDLQSSYDEWRAVEKDLLVLKRELNKIIKFASNYGIDPTWRSSTNHVEVYNIMNESFLKQCPAINKRKSLLYDLIDKVWRDPHSGISTTLLGAVGSEISSVRWNMRSKSKKLDRYRRKRYEERKAHEKAVKAAVSGKTRATSSPIRTKLDRTETCPYCGGPLGISPHADHIHPVSKGGLAEVKNMVFVCSECNSKKSNMTLNQFIDKFNLHRESIFNKLKSLGKDY
jgi:5-methylcytosine-specific restriction endonuclease McrA